MSAKLNLRIGVTLLFVFIVCGYLIGFHDELFSGSDILTYTLLAVTATSLFLWPVFMARWARRHRSK